MLLYVLVTSLIKFISEDYEHKQIQLTLRNLNSQVQNVIFPGTKWCGVGDLATSPEDLGIFRATDMCCRQHDSCPQSIAFGTTQYGLTNTGFFTWSHCDCDSAFYECLKESHDIISNLIGFIYFTVLAPMCFREDYPIVQCEKHEYTAFSLKRETRHRCVQYELNTNESKIYEWFDSRFY